MSASSGQATVLQSCGILFLFRALREARDIRTRAHIEMQLIELIMDFTGASGGAVALATSEELRPPQESPGDVRAVESLISHVGAGAPWIDEESATVACPIHEHGHVAGMLAAWFHEAKRPPEDLQSRLDTLAGIATLAGSALDGSEASQTPPPAPAVSRIEIPEVIGESPAMQRVLRMVRRIAPSDATVLIEGESGAGKDVIARALHDLSPRKPKPFFAINCAVLTESLLESELFGHERGAFTGAIAQKKGKLELADGGTLFLDEIGELAPSLQAKLLRVLQQREFERVGGTKTLRLDVRLIAATNRDLRGQVKKGAFREDLFHRLNVISIGAPSLRERPDDIMPLALHFLQRARARATRKISGISDEAQKCLMRYSWPGNVRELENAIERAIVLGESDLIGKEDLPPAVLEGEGEAALPEFELSVSSAKRESILRAWAESNGDYRKAAELLGLHPNSLLRLVRKMNLRDELNR